MKEWKDLKFWDTEWPKVYNRIWNRQHDERILPAYPHVFRALDLCPYSNVKAVIIGQDPYPTKGHAHGLSFSCQPHVRPLPRSLRNIFQEYHEDLGYDFPRNGDLSVWAERGVLLLNTILTVEEGKSLSHEGMGWERLTYEIVRSLSEKPVVFLLMGKKAQEFAGALDASKVVRVPHPSPRVKGFSGTRPFSAVNAKLRDLGVEEVEWRLP